MNGRNLNVNFTGALNINYARIDNALNTNNIRDIFSYTSIQGRLSNGVENNEADLAYHATRQYLTAGGTETIDLDAADLSNIFGDELRFELVKALIIKNNEALDQWGLGKYLSVALGAEAYLIGPQGYRVIWEPTGLFDSGGSTGVAGILSLSSGDDISYDLIVIGSSALVNLISSGS